MATKKILVPYNFSLYDQKAIDFVNQTFSAAADLEITLFNSYIPMPEIQTDQSTVMGKLDGNLRYLSQKLKEQEVALKGVKQTLLDSGFTDAQVKYVHQPRKKDVATDIIKMAWQGGFQVIVLTRKAGKVTRFFTGSVFNRVVSALKDVTVCIVS